MVRLAAAALLSLSVACGGASAQSSTPASQGVSRYLSALKRDDSRAAYALLSREVRKELSYEEFLAQWKASKTERSAQRSSLEEEMDAGSGLGERATIEYGDGRKVTLRREAGRWHLESGLISPTHAVRPHDAIQIFAAALKSRDFDSTMRILTRKRRDGLSHELQVFVESLEAHLADDSHEIYLVGSDRAELKWSSDEADYKLVLLKEDGEWRVDDILLLPAEPEEDPEGDEEETEAKK